MNGRKLAAFALSGVMAVGLTACGGNGEPNESPAGGSGGEAYLVGICQLAPHDALDAATRGFKAALVEAFGEDGVKFDEQTPAASTTTAPPSWTALCRKMWT